MAKTKKAAAPAVEKKTKVKKVIEKPKPVQKSTVKKVVKAEKKAAIGGISGKYTGVKEKKAKAVVPATEAPVSLQRQKYLDGIPGNHNFISENWCFAQT